MSDQPDDCTTLKPGHARFYDAFVPPLGVGDFLINVAQRIDPVNRTGDPKKTIDESWVASQPFSVQGPRYSLPPDDLFSMLPPENGIGVFEQILPQVVLTKRDLPWERDLFGDELTGQTPWMALLLFTEGESIGGGPPLLAPLVAGWTPNRNLTATLAAAAFYDGGARRTQPDADGTLWPSLEPEWYEQEGDFLQTTLASVIDLSPEAFATLVPGREELRLLTHVRQVETTAKEAQVLGIGGEGWYSVVVGKRLPDPPLRPEGSDPSPGRRNIAHLVSLEGFEPYLSESGPTALPAGTKRVRMVALRSWSFTCLAEAGESFRELMDGLLKDDAGAEKPTALRLPVDPPPDVSDDARFAYAALRDGYVPLRYETRQGEQTFAWYRGPLTPVPVANWISAAQQDPNDASAWEPLDRASSALVYDPARGIFDVSYGVAWETGRLLALANDHFSQELLDWQRKGHRLLDLILERRAQVAALSGFDPDNPDPATEKALLDLIQQYAVTGDFVKYLLNRLQGQLAPVPPGTTPGGETVAPFPAYPSAPAPVPSPRTIQELLTQPAVQDAVRAVGGEELDDIADWLARLYLLYGVPFENLVPHAELLPPESVRFFYLDSNWLDALVEGALSIGIESSRDRLYQALMKDLVWNTTFSAVQAVRDALLGSLATEKPKGATTPFDQQSLTGMLLRSAAVAGWPGLTVNGFTSTLPGSPDPDIETRMGLLRMERLSSDVMLCLWPAVPAVVTIDEPAEGIAFGFEDGPGTAKGYWLYLRSITDDGGYAMPLCSAAAIADGSCAYALDAAAALVIDPATRLLRLTGAGGLVDQVRRRLPGAPSTLTVRDFAVQMIRVPEQAVFASSNGEPR